MKATPRMETDIRLSIFFPCSDCKQNRWYSCGYFKMRKQLKFFWIWRPEMLWKISPNLYFHYDTSCKNSDLLFPLLYYAHSNFESRWIENLLSENYLTTRWSHPYFYREDCRYWRKTFSPFHLPQKRCKLHTVFRIDHVMDDFVVVQDGLGDI